MSVEVKFHIHTKIKHADGTKEEFTYQTDGNLYDKNNERFLRYKEQPELGNTWSILKWNSNSSPEKLSIIRQGEIKSNQLFQKGLLNKSLYHSPHGILDMETRTTQLRIEEKTSTEGKISIQYNLTINKNVIGNYNIEINYS